MIIAVIFMAPYLTDKGEPHRALQDQKNSVSTSKPHK